ncbi:hypothetical protein C8R44DRAFT_720545 [Mycena epipterygia]|nr:hypothetical protein C8R44DRAFT_722460 [Mycena epipterygia]KAJ7089165.1 hypothetical protein C8R44DRAFT_720545 [Mycena epipterygia]
MPPRPPATRPATISELAAAAQADADAGGTRELKHYLRRADTHRRTGQALDAGTDLERAFIEFARAATLILETIPGHRDYATTLKGEQRANLTAVSRCLFCGRRLSPPLLLSFHSVPHAI